MKWIVPLLTFWLIVSCSVNKPAADTYTSDVAGGNLEGTSYLRTYTNEQGQKVREIRNHQISRHTAMLTDIPNELTMESILTQKHFPGYDTCTPGKLKVNFYKSHEDSLVLYRAYATTADHYEFLDNSGDIFKTETDPCKAQNVTGHVYSLYSPKPVITYHDQYNRITLPRTDIVRYTGFQPHGGILPFRDVHQEDNLIGILHYGSKRGSKARIAISSNDRHELEQARKEVPKVFILAERAGSTIRSKDMELYPDQGEDFYKIPTNFSIEVNFTWMDKWPPIVIPVENDSVKIDRATVPKPYSIELLR